jgi:hypothetical protein
MSKKIYRRTFLARMVTGIGSNLLLGAYGVTKSRDFGQNHRDEMILAARVMFSN